MRSFAFGLERRIGSRGKKSLELRTLLPISEFTASPELMGSPKDTPKETGQHINYNGIGCIYSIIGYICKNTKQNHRHQHLSSSSSSSSHIDINTPPPQFLKRLQQTKTKKRQTPGCGQKKPH